jgi:hypothetical protein
MINFDLKKYINPIFIETGTGLAGLGVKKALEAGFEKIYSIEICESIHLDACHAFADEIRSGQVELILGDSITALPALLDTIDKPCTFWLDSHIDGPQSAGLSHKKCPLYDELYTISKHYVDGHIIMIDDRRLFYDNETRDNPNGWGASILETAIVDQIKNINKNYSIVYENGFIDKDVIVGVMKCGTCRKVISQGEFCDECWDRDKSMGRFE